MRESERPVRRVPTDDVRLRSLLPEVAVARETTAGCGGLERDNWIRVGIGLGYQEVVKVIENVRGY
jgi:hypothetical protein